MNQSLQQQKDVRIAEEAAQWLIALEKGGPREHEAFAKWLTESRRNVEEFLFASAVERALDNVDARRRWDIEEVLKQAEGNVVPLASDVRSIANGRKRGTARWAAGIAASIAVAVTTTLLVTHDWGWQNYDTAVGEQRTVELADGSSVHLNTRSKVQVRYTQQGRDLRLVEGEALFDARRDTARPFRVRAGDAVIQALGTRFNVYRHSHKTTVAVIEGTVKVTEEKETSTEVLKAGQQASIDGQGKIAQQTAVDVAQVAVWRQRRLIFRADTLTDIAAEFNRYNRTPQIQIDDDAVGARRFTGIFNADDPQALVQFLAGYGDLAVHETVGELRIRRKTP